MSLLISARGAGDDFGSRDSTGVLTGGRSGKGIERGVHRADASRVGALVGEEAARGLSANDSSAQAQLERGVPPVVHGGGSTTSGSTCGRNLQRTSRRPRAAVRASGPVEPPQHAENTADSGAGGRDISGLARASTTSDEIVESAFATIRPLQHRPSRSTSPVAAWRGAGPRILRRSSARTALEERQGTLKAASAPELGGREALSLRSAGGMVCGHQRTVPYRAFPHESCSYPRSI